MLTEDQKFILNYFEEKWDLANLRALHLIGQDNREDLIPAKIPEELKTFAIIFTAVIRVAELPNKQHVFAECMDTFQSLFIDNPKKCAEILKKRKNG